MFAYSQNEFNINEPISFIITPDDNTTSIDFMGNTLALTDGGFSLTIPAQTTVGQYDLQFTKLDGDDINAVVPFSITVVDPTPITVTETETVIPDVGYHNAGDIGEKIDEDEKLRTSNRTTTIPDDEDNKYRVSVANEEHSHRTPHTSADSRNSKEFASSQAFERIEERKEKFGHRDRVKALPNNLILGTGLGVKDVSGRPNSAEDNANETRGNRLDSGVWAVTF